MSDETLADETPTFNHRDLAGYAMLFCILFVAIALATYDPADAIGKLIAPFDRLYQQDLTIGPPHATIHNQCGWWGALMADVLLTVFGFGAYVIVAGLTYVDFQLLRRQPIDTLAYRIIGGSLSLVAFTGFLNLAMPDTTPGPVWGSGGAIGALVGWALERHFATTGGMILCFSGMIAGLLIATDYAVYRAAAMAGGALATAGRGARGRRGVLDRPATDVEDAFVDGIPGAEEDESEHEVAIKIRGNSVDDDEADIDEDWDDEGWEEEEEDDDNEEESFEADPEEEEIVVKTPRPKSKRNEEEPSEREQVFADLNEADFEEDDDYELPGLELLVAGDEISYDAQRKELAHKAKLLEKTFKDFGLNVKVVEIETGPVIAQYEIELEPGLRLSKITNLADDIAIALRVPSVRIVSPIPGKNTVGIEVPNAKRQMVRLRDVIEETNGKAKKMKIPLFLGQDVSGNPMAADLAALPHLLIAGRTGTGKSVCLNAIISSILMTKRPDEVRMLMIDPKMVELSGYGRLPHLMHPVVTDMKKAEAILAWAVDKMEERYSLLARAGVRHITSYNQLGDEELMDRLGAETEEEQAEIPQHLPFIVIIADEMADLMMTAGKEVEQHIIRLAQKSRAVGIHLILATQKPTVDVITGLIKSNLPARISFQVASRTDSRVVLDEMGAEKLLGNGDMLFLWPGTSTLLRGQGTYLGDEEIDRVVDAASSGAEQNFVNELVNMNVAAEGGEDRMEELRKRDDLYESAIEVVIREQRGSCSLLQRSLGIGYGRAARLIDFMAEDGIVGSYAGSQAREVLLTMEDWERMQGFDGGDDDPPPPRPSKPKPEREEAPAPSAATKTRTDEASEVRPQRITAEAAVNSQPSKPKRKNRIVLREPQEIDAEDDDDLEFEETEDGAVKVVSGPTIKGKTGSESASAEADSDDVEDARERANASNSDSNTVIDIEVLTSGKDQQQHIEDDAEGPTLDEEEEEAKDEGEEERYDDDEADELDDEYAEEEEYEDYEYEYEEEDDEEDKEGEEEVDEEELIVASESDEDDEGEEDEDYEYDESAYDDEYEYEYEYEEEDDEAA